MGFLEPIRIQATLFIIIFKKSQINIGLIFSISPNPIIFVSPIIKKEPIYVLTSHFSRNMGSLNLNLMIPVSRDFR
jgi:hypothetical protein